MAAGPDAMKRSTAMSIAPYVDVRVTQRFNTSVERVFNAWLDPETAGLWLFATALRPMSSVTIDARAGGWFRFAERLHGGGAVKSGQYLEIVRPRRLVFTLADTGRLRDVSRVSVEIVPLKTGCELTLVHENVLPDDADRTGGRWDGMLYGLAAMLGRG